MLPAHTYNHWASDSTDRLQVKSGQKVYIRLRQNEDENYKVNTNPEIIYVDPLTGADILNNSLEEQDGFNINSGSYEDNFMLNNHDAPLRLTQPGALK